ncbi:D-3-phosphoglycerate dehydrogenase [Hyaloscypha sp. PMI_1271]|nr:D-3-phosphoglycerate dehydrogenase [Hyaloscypha sp. PMI_1271]
MTSITTSRKPKVLSFGPINYADGGEGYMKDFEKQWDIDILKPTTRIDTIANLKTRVSHSGPYDALMIHDLDLIIDEEMLTPLLPGLKVVVSASAGYNEFDVNFMTANGIWFCNARHAVSEATADMAVFLILAVVRDTTRGEKQVRDGRWRGQITPTLDPNGLTLGIIGMGGIGKHIAKKISCFEMKVHYYNRTRLSPEDEHRYGAKYCSSMGELLSISDVVSVNCPLNASTRGLIGKAEFARMRDGSFIVNTARGAIVDDESLIEAVKSGKIARAGLDVFTDEPKVNPYFVECDRFTLQPHLGGMTVGTFKKAERECCENLKAWSQSGKPLMSINKA